MERRHTVLLLLLILATSAVAFFLWYLSKNNSSLLPPTTTGETRLSDAFYFRTINFADTTVYWIPIEFVGEPSVVFHAYHVKAILDGDRKTHTFDVLVGSVTGNIQVGSCEYDRVKNTFTGNATWNIENTKDVIPKIATGVKGMLRFYTPVNVTDQERRYYNDRLASLDTLLSTARAGGQLSKDYLIVPEEICIEQ